MTVNLDCLIFFDCFSKRAHLRRPGQLIRSTRGADQGSVDRQDHGRESCVSRHARAGPLARRAGTLARERAHVWTEGKCWSRMLNTLAAIADRKAGFRSLGDTWADTTTAHGRLMLTVLGGLAEFERDLIRARTSEGRERAKARGVKLGRKPKLTEHQKREAIRRRDVDGETVREIARSYNVSHSTISRLTAS